MECSDSVDLVKILLDEVNFGPWQYQTTEEKDIALFHRAGSSNLYIRTHSIGTNDAPPATFTVRDITALDLALVSSVPGSLETMAVRCALETESDIFYESDTAEKGTCELSCRLISMKTSVNKAGELRDLLLQLKTGYQEPTENDPALQKAGTDALPAWVFYIPTGLYTRKVRIALEKLLLFYTVMSVFWACWQLYRHVHIIQVTFLPLVVLLKKYLASAMEAFDRTFVVFTELWMQWYSPLSIVLTPILLSLKYSLIPIQTFCTLLITNVSQLFASSPLLLALKGVLQSVSLALVTQGWKLVVTLAWPLRQVSLYLVSSPLAVASLDASRVQFNWVLGLVTSSSKAIGNGMVKFFNYLMRRKQRKVLLKSPTRLSIETPRTKKCITPHTAF